MLYGPNVQTTPSLFTVFDIANTTIAARTVANLNNVLHHPSSVQVIFGRVGSLATINIFETVGFRLSV